MPQDEQLNLRLEAGGQLFELLDHPEDRVQVVPVAAEQQHAAVAELLDLHVPAEVFDDLLDGLRRGGLRTVPLRLFAAVPVVTPGPIAAVRAVAAGGDLRGLALLAAERRQPGEDRAELLRHGRLLRPAGDDLQFGARRGPAVDRPEGVGDAFGPRTRGGDDQFVAGFVHLHREGRRAGHVRLRRRPRRVRAVNGEGGQARRTAGHQIGPRAGRL